MYTADKIDNVIYYLLCFFAISSSISEKIASFILAILLILSIIRCYFKKPIWDINLGFKKPLLFFVGIFFVFAIISPDISRGFSQYWWIISSMAPVFFISIFIKNKDKAIFIFKLLYLSMFINIVYAVFGNINVWLDAFGATRLFGFDWIITFASRLLIFIPITLIFIYEKVNNKIFIPILLLSFLATIINGTRIVWLIVPLIFIIISCMYIKKIKNLISLCLMLVIALLLVFNLSSNIENKINSLTEFKDTSIKGHYYIGLDTINMIKDYPILGIGLGQFKNVYNEQYKSEQTAKVELGRVFHAHNNTLMIMAETGVVGVITFWYMFGSFLFLTYQKWYRYREISHLIMFSITLTLMLQGITENSFGLRPVMMIYFSILGLYLVYNARIGRV